MSIEFTFSSVYKFKSTTEIKYIYIFYQIYSKTINNCQCRHCLNSVQTICIGGAITKGLH